MMEFILSLNEFTVSALTIMLLTLLTATYRLNIRLAQYAIVGKKWEVTDKINKLGKRMVMFGGLATLPLVVILILTIKSSSIESEIFRNIGIVCTFAWFAGCFSLIASIPVLIMALVGRVYLSDLSMVTVLLAFFKTIKNKLQPHWRIIVLSVSAMILLVVIWPLIQGLLYIGAVLLLGRIGALDGHGNNDNNDNNEWNYINDDDDYLDINNKTDEENYQHEVDLGFH